jgi:hypothetical protein
MYGIRRRVQSKSLFSWLVVRVLVHLSYITGLTLLIPFLFLLLLPADGVVLSQSVPPLLLIMSLLLIFVSFVIMVWHKRRVDSALRSLGLITLVPGGIAVFFSFFGRDAIFLLLERYVFAEGLEALIMLYVDQTIPKVKILIWVYVFVGLLLWLLGHKIRRFRRRY